MQPGSESTANAFIDYILPAFDTTALEIKQDQA